MILCFLGACNGIAVCSACCPLQPQSPKGVVKTIRAHAYLRLLSFVHAGAAGLVKSGCGHWVSVVFRVSRMRPLLQMSRIQRPPANLTILRKRVWLVLSGDSGRKISPQMITC